MAYDCDILIVGGGLAGPALALALAQVGYRVTIIDALPTETLSDQDFDGRAYALALTSVRLLRAIGIWEHVADHSQPMLDIRVSDGRAGEGATGPSLHFDHTEIEEGPMGHMLEDRFLRRAMIEALQADERITLMTGTRVTAQSVSADGAEITLDTGQTLRTQLLVGADGRQSGTATRAGIKRTGWGYDQTALVCAVEHEQPHNGIAYQFFMPPGPLAILPLPENRSSIVWSERSQTAQDFMALDDAAFIDVLKPRFGDFLGDIRLTGKRFSYPLGLSLAQTFIADRVALVGDAAHGVHPLAGQGLNAGLRDVGALAHVLTEARQRGEDPSLPGVLTRYQQWRRFDTTTLAATTDLTNRLFSNDNPILRLGRDLGLGVVNALPNLRRALIREAAGLTGDLPALMR